MTLKTAYFVATGLSRHGAEGFGGQDKILARAVNVRPAFPGKGMEILP
jgi:hypothetical protein